MTKMRSRAAYDKRLKEHPQFAHNGACLVLDVDGLKKVNDVYGHLAGDALICDAADCILAVYAKYGECYRIGGDEFVVLLENVTEEDVLALIDELAEQVARKKPTPPLSFSIGYALADSSDWLVNIIDSADKKMYLQKKERRSSSVLR